MPTTFSIIIPTYNRASHLPSAIVSVLEQSRTDWELIIVDDGSTDGTREAVLPYTSDSRVHYQHQENRELNGARNTGVRLAKGTYCCLLDDDDHYETNHLEALFCAIVATGGRHGMYRANMRIIGKGIDFVSIPFDNERDALLQLWENPRNFLPLAIHRELLCAQPFDEEDLLIDDFVWLNTALINTTLFQTDAVTTTYIQHASNRSKLYHSVTMLPKIVGRLKEAYAILGVSERVDESLLNFRIYHQHMHLSRQGSRRGETLVAFRVWVQGIQYSSTSSLVETIKTLILALLSVTKRR